MAHEQTRIKYGVSEVTFSQTEVPLMECCGDLSCTHAGKLRKVWLLIPWSTDGHS